MSALVPYTPANKFHFHEIDLNISNNAKSFVCEEFQINHGMITLYNVRMPKTFYDTTNRNVYSEILFDDYNVHYKVYRFETHTKEISDFNVKGYTSISSMTFNISQVIGIKSYSDSEVTIDPKTWYNIDSDKAQIMIEEDIDKHNERVSSKNSSLVTKEFLESAYTNDMEHTQVMQVKEAIERWKELGFFKRLFTPPPVNVDIMAKIVEPQRIGTVRWGYDYALRKNLKFGCDMSEFERIFIN